MSQYIPAEIARRRAIEDELLALGEDRASLSREESWNSERIRRLVGPARESGIKVRDISRMTGLSTQTLHTWMLELMRPIPDIHLALAGPPPRMLEQSVLRTMGEKSSDHEWQADEVRATIPNGWPSGSVQEVDAALERMARWHMIWDGESGYRVAPPDEISI
jgi:hypothetical protein